MSNNIPIEILEIINSRECREAFFVDIFAESGVTKLHTGVGNVEFNGDTYIGVGSFGGMSGQTTDTDTSAKTIDLSLSGLIDENINAALNEDLIGTDVDIYHVFLERDRLEVRASYLLSTGFIVDQSLSAGDENVFMISVGDHFSRWANGRSDRYSFENHMARNPGDARYYYLAQTASAEIKWGSTATSERYRYANT